MGGPPRRRRRRPNDVRNCGVRRSGCARARKSFFHWRGTCACFFLLVKLFVPDSIFQLAMALQVLNMEEIHNL